MKKLNVILILFLAVTNFACMDDITKSIDEIKESKVVSLLLYNMQNGIPEAPSNFIATAKSDSEIYLTWNDNSDNELGFYIFRKDINSQNWDQIGDCSVNNVSYTDSDVNLLEDHTYFYHIVAYNKAGISRVSEVEIKTLPYKLILWDKTFGKENILRQDYANAVCQTSDGGYLVAGETFSYGNLGQKIMILKLDKDGNELWRKIYDENSNEENWARSILQTADGGYVVAGVNRASYLRLQILKFDQNGNLLWRKLYGTGASEAYSLQQTADGGYITCGYTMSGVLYVLKLDENGNIPANDNRYWERIFSGNQLIDGVGYSIQEVKNEYGEIDAYIVAGEIRENNNPSDMLILKLNLYGYEIWRKKYGDSTIEKAYSIRQTKDHNNRPNGYIVVGINQTDSDVWLLKIDKDGNMGDGYPGTWKKVFNNKYVICWGSPIQQTRDLGYIITGYDWIYKLNESGNVTQEWVINIADFFSNSVQQTKDDGYIIVGGDTKKADMRVVKLARLR